LVVVSVFVGLPVDITDGCCDPACDGFIVVTAFIVGRAEGPKFLVGAAERLGTPVGNED